MNVCPRRIRRAAMARASMLLSWLPVALVALVAALMSGSASAADYRVGAAPAWVIPVDPMAGTPVAAPARGGVRALLSDEQVRVEARGMTRYRHFASLAVDSEGVGDVASVSMAFDPSYQSLTLHRLNILRAGRVIDKLGTASIQVLRRETNLEQRIYDGSRTLSVVLDDVRPGDAVEYAYSVSGSNPVFGNMASGGFDLQWTVPVGRVVARLLTPVERGFTVAARNTALQPLLSEAGGYHIRHWELAPASGLRIERDVPADHDPYAYVLWSEYPSWQAVARWAVPLYAPPADPGPELRREIEAIRVSATTPDARALAVLRFVQREIRYLGIAMGPGSHAPSAPALVLQRRFGDCKDKTLLTITMLGALGIDAVPALVNTGMRSAVRGWAPTPNAFDHLLVLARIGGKRYWLDPTMAPQKGELAHLVQPDFGAALVVAAGTTGLSAMDAPRPAHASVRALFDMRVPEGQPVRYTVTTTARGIAAERLRRVLADGSLDELQERYLEFYARRYPGIAAAAPLKVRDDEAANVVTVSESYTIRRFWTVSTSDQRVQAVFGSADLRARLDVPQSLKRSAPLALRYPESVEEVTEVRLARGWDLKESSMQIDDPAFVFSHRAQSLEGGHALRLTSRYEARADRVAPAALAAYAANMTSARDAIGYRMSRVAGGAGVVEKYRHRMGRTVLGLTAFLGLLLAGTAWMQSIPSHRVGNALVSLSAAGAACGLVYAVMLSPSASSMVRVLMLTFCVATQGVVLASALAPVTHPLHGAQAPDGTTAARPALPLAVNLAARMSGWTFTVYLLWMLAETLT